MGKLVTIKRAIAAGECPPNALPPEGLEEAIYDYFVGWQLVGGAPVVFDDANTGDGVINPWAIVGHMVQVGTKSAVVSLNGKTLGHDIDDYRLVITVKGKPKGEVYHVESVVRFSIVPFDVLKEDTNE